VAGQIHPNILRRHGPAYRDSLERRAEALGLSNSVQFEDSYQSDESLYQLAARADVIVIPYDNDEQVCSGVLTEAVTSGRPVVATDFPHARELLGSGAGVVVPHGDTPAMTAAIEQYLTDDFAYRRAVEEARIVGQRLSWSTIARRHVEYLDRLGETVAVS
jgi:glycosyltransferase involved in cell wall biosynthesis